MPNSKRQRIRIILVDDHPVVRQGLIAILSTFEEISVEGEASSGQEAIAVARELKPDVIVMDISMPSMGGIEATAALQRELPESKVLALSMHDNRSYVTQALRAGARGYILKDSAPEALVRAISDVHNGSLPISPQAATAFMGSPFKNRGEPELTPREIDVLRFIAQGLTNKEISVQLNLGVRTVETHRENLIRKTGRATVAELTRYAVMHGHVALNSSQ
jgi:two-component system, NarL family, nitrate/nitrite response regulator NarL